MEVIDSLEPLHFYYIFLGEHIPSMLLDQVLELALQYVAIEGFFDFVFPFSLSHNRFHSRYSPTRKGVIADRLMEGYMEDGVDTYHCWEV
jgi:hypothetical protein